MFNISEKFAQSQGLQYAKHHVPGKRYFPWKKSLLNIYNFVLYLHWVCFMLNMWEQGTTEVCWWSFTDVIAFIGICTAKICFLHKILFLFFSHNIITLSEEMIRYYACCFNLLNISRVALFVVKKVFFYCCLKQIYVFLKWLESFLIYHDIIHRSVSLSKCFVVFFCCTLLGLLSVPKYSIISRILLSCICISFAFYFVHMSLFTWFQVRYLLYSWTLLLCHLKVHTIGIQLKIVLGKF